MKKNTPLPQWRITSLDLFSLQEREQQENDPYNLWYQMVMYKLYKREWERLFF